MNENVKERMIKVETITDSCKQRIYEGCDIVEAITIASKNVSIDTTLTIDNKNEWCSTYDDIKKLANLSNDVKLCSHCKKILPIHHFCKLGNGYQSWCKECKKERYHSKKNTEYKTKDKNEHIHKVYAHLELAKFTPRQLMEELKSRGFKWDYMLEPQRKIMFDKI